MQCTTFCAHDVLTVVYFIQKERAATGGSQITRGIAPRRCHPGIFHSATRLRPRATMRCGGTDARWWWTWCSLRGVGGSLSAALRAGMPRYRDLFLPSNESSKSRAERRRRLLRIPIGSIIYELDLSDFRIFCSSYCHAAAEIRGLQQGRPRRVPSALAPSQHSTAATSSALRFNGGGSERG